MNDSQRRWRIWRKVRRAARQVVNAYNARRAARRLRRCNVSGATPKILDLFPLIQVGSGSELRFGENCCIWSTDRDQTVFYVPNGRLIVGNNVYINQGAVFLVEGGCAIILGDHSKIGNNVRIFTSNYHPVSEGESVRSGDVRLGRNCWIGTNVTILPNVTIGAHSVVATGSIVTKDVPEKSVIAGAPAKGIDVVTCSDDWIRP